MRAVTDETAGPVQVFEPEPGRLYTLEAAAHLAGIPRRTLLVYCRAGVVQPSVHPEYGALFFDDRAVQTARRAEALRKLHTMDLTGVRVIFDLLEEVDQLRRELDFWRGA